MIALNGDTRRFVMQVVCAHYRVTEESILSKDRHKPLVSARHLSMWLLRLAGFSFPEIGREMNRDHTSIMSACKNIDSHRLKDSRLQDVILALTAEIEGLQGSSNDAKNEPVREPIDTWLEGRPGFRRIISVQRGATKIVRLYEGVSIGSGRLVGEGTGVTLSVACADALNDIMRREELMESEREKERNSPITGIANRGG